MAPLPREDLIVLMEGGYIYLRMGKFEEAREVFDGVSILAPDTEVPLVALGSVAFSQMKYDQAIQCYKRALALKPDSAFARAYMGEALFFKGKKDEGMTELQKAAEMEPHGKSGDFARALMEAIKGGFTPPGLVVKH